MLNTLRDITQAVAAAHTLELALETLVAQTKAAMETECCSIYILEHQQLVLSATDGLAKDAIGRVKMSLSEGLVGLVAEREEAINLADAHLHPRFKLFPEANEEVYRAFLAAPIIYQKRLLGVIVVQQANARQFNEGEEAFLMTLAAQLAMAIRGLKRRTQVQAVDHQVLFSGTCASPGIAIANALVLGGEISLLQPELRSTDSRGEASRLRRAIARSREALSALAQKFENDHDDELSSIFTSLRSLLEDASLGGEYLQEVAAGWSAESAVSRVSQRYVVQFEAMEESYLRERAGDIRDLGQRVLRQLIEPGRMTLEPDKPVILVTREADTGMLAEIPRQKLAGIVTEAGGVNSHAAILARALGVPAIMGVEQVLQANLDGQLLVLHASRGLLMVSPSAAVVNEYRHLISTQQALDLQYAEELKAPAITRDGHRIHLYLNAGLMSGVVAEIADGADGIGLYRTEIPFMLQQRFPSESEQIKVYRQVLASAAGRPVVMRTLDVGGDKPLPYFPIAEENPFLGWRGIRLSLDHPELFLVQLRAMLQASGNGDNLRILLPMVSCLEEIDEALLYLEQAFAELKADINPALCRPPVGVMLEVPVLLYQLAEVAKRVEFVSVGSNDLTQYLLAVDRNNPRVSGLYESFHPGVLRALHRTVQECRGHGLAVSVCGELAGEAMGALLLVAMGYDELSMNQGSLAKVNYLLRRVARSELEELLAQVLQRSSGQEVRELLRDFLDARGLAAMLG